MTDIDKALSKAREMSAIFEYRNDIVIGGSKMYPLLLDVVDAAIKVEKFRLVEYDSSSASEDSLDGLDMAVRCWAKAVNDGAASQEQPSPKL